MSKRRSQNHNHNKNSDLHIPIDPDNFIDNDIKEEDENTLLRMITERELDLQKCINNTKNLSAIKKKRIRNRHASGISRLKKKLFYLKLTKQFKHLQKEFKKKEDELKKAYQLIDILKKSQDIDISNSSSDIEIVSEFDEVIQDNSNFNTYFCDYDELYTQNKNLFCENQEINITD
jgi:hypothetical protein